MKPISGNFLTLHIIVACHSPCRMAKRFTRSRRVANPQALYSLLGHSKREFVHEKKRTFDPVDLSQGKISGGSKGEEKKLLISVWNEKRINFFKIATWRFRTMVSRKSAFLALKSLTFASPRLLPLALYLLSRESTPPIGRRGESLLGNCLWYLGRRCHGSRRSADVHLDSAFTWPIPVILRDLIAVIAVVAATIFSPSEVPVDIHGFTLLAIDVNRCSSERREKERGRERAKLQDIAVREEKKREGGSVRNYGETTCLIDRLEHPEEVDPGSGCDPSVSYVDYDRLCHEDIEDTDLIESESSNQQVWGHLLSSFYNLSTITASTSANSCLLTLKRHWQLTAAAY